MATRHNRSGQHLFIHKRGVLVPLISFAVRDGYGTMLPTGRHPVYVLHLTMPSNYLDVNVHPQKREVRLRQERTLKELIIFSVEAALQKGKCSIPSVFSETPALEIERSFAPPSPQYFSKEYYSPFDERKTNLFEVKEHRPFGPTTERPYQMPVLEKHEPYTSPIPTLSSIQSLPELKSNSEIHSSFQKSEDSELFDSLNQSKSTIQKLKALGILKRFIIAIDEEGNQIFLIDQRAAHGRIIYEKLVNTQTTTLELQMLLIPHLLELPASEASFLREKLVSLQEAGIHIKEFGPTSFVIDALPQIFGNIDLHKLVDEIVKNSYEGVQSKAFEKEVKKKLAQAASRAAITSESRINLIEAQHLLDTLMDCQYPKQCPYGKATFVTLALADIVKLFNA